MPTSPETKRGARFRSIDEAVRSSGISASQLRKLKADGRFSAGIEYIYISGCKGGPVGWDPIAIENWQIRQSQLIADAPAKAANEIESFAAMGV